MPRSANPRLTRTLRVGSLLAVLAGLGELIACGSSDTNGEPSDTGTGGSQTATGGGGNSLATGGVGGGGVPSSGGAQATGGVGPTGGMMGSTGGTQATGGMTATGGTTPDTGGMPPTGGATVTGGTPPTGGDTATGGTSEGGASPTGGAAGSSAGGTGGGGDVVPSSGCGETPTLNNSPQSTNFQVNTLSAGGTNREYVIRWPSDYDNTHPYRLHLTLHGYGGTYAETAGNYFGLWDLADNSTIFIALSAIDVNWQNGDNLAYVDAVLEAVEADLCIDTSRISLEGFSQGAAMSWTLACSRPGVFRAVVGHSGGGVTNPSSCEPIPYLGSGGLQENVTQTTQSDQFARWNGCDVTSLPTAPSGGHVCTNYTGCPDEDPVRWCNYDGPHTPSPTDSGQSSSWMPEEVWTFLSQF